MEIQNTDNNTPPVPLASLTAEQSALVDDIQETLNDYLDKRERLNQRIAQLRDKAGELLCPYEVGDVLKRKGDRSWWLVKEVKWSPVHHWALHVTTVTRAGNTGKGLIRWLPNSQENLRKYGEFDSETKEVTKV